MGVVPQDGQGGLVEEPAEVHTCVCEAGRGLGVDGAVCADHDGQDVAGPAGSDQRTVLGELQRVGLLDPPRRSDNEVAEAVANGQVWLEVVDGHRRVDGDVPGAAETRALSILVCRATWIPLMALQRRWCRGRMGCLQCMHVPMTAPFW